MKNTREGNFPHVAPHPCTLKNCLMRSINAEKSIKSRTLPTSMLPSWECSAATKRMRQRLSNELHSSLENTASLYNKSKNPSDGCTGQHHQQREGKLPGMKLE